MINDKVDMHVHTTASDGSFTPLGLVNEAKAKGIGFLSVTDHDSIENVEETGKLCHENGIAFVPGVEISSTHNKEMFHILAYDFDGNNKELYSLLRENQKLMEKKDEDCIKTLIDSGYSIDFEEYVNYKYNHARGGWKALNFLIDNKVCNSLDDYFERIFCDKMKIYYPKFKEPEEVIKTIKNAGGKAILAHPMYGLSEMPLLEMLELFKNMNIDGIECFHPKHNSKVTKECFRWCIGNNMLITGGSDCHGTFITSRKIGVPEINLTDIRFYKE